VTFNLFRTANCTGPSSGETVSLNGLGVADSTAFVLTTAGALSYLVEYSGDQSYVPEISQVCESLALDKIQPRLTTEIHFPDHNVIAGNPATGTTVHDTAIVSAPSGNVGVLPVPAGSVSLTSFTGGGCTSGTPHATGAVVIGGWSSGVGTGGTGIADGST
jgi:hypothetical protein